jgi:photosystem II oxygen-evolving enhancer protein 2
MGRFINLILAAAPLTVSGFSVPNDSQVVSRRESFAKAASVIGGTIAAGGLVMNPSAASAVVTDETPIVTTRQGGLLEKYQDSRGWKILAPSGWNGFDGEVGAYDKKWQDLVDPYDNIKLSSTPVKSTTTSIDILGPVEDVGASLASKRDAKLIAATERQTEGILFYTFDFAINDGTHQLLLLCVNKGKIWSLDASTREKKYSKRKELYYNVLGSFMPKLS